MSTAPDRHSSPGRSEGERRGATALGTDAEGRPRRHPRHVVGNTLRAARVFAASALDVVVRGDLVDAHSGADRAGPPGRPRR